MWSTVSSTAAATGPLSVCREVPARHIRSTSATEALLSRVWCWCLPRPPAALPRLLLPERRQPPLPRLRPPVLAPRPILVPPPTPAPAHPRALLPRRPTPTPASRTWRLPARLP